MTPIRETGGGCARKVGPSELAANLAAVETHMARVPAGAVTSRIDIVDACEVTIRQAARTFVTSSDLLYAVSGDLYTCGYVAVVHALSDIFAVLGDPAWATVTVGLPHRDVDEGGLALILKGSADALFADGVVFAGGHSVYSPDVFISVSVSGVAHGRVTRQAPIPGDMLVLTKPLGSGIALSGLRLGLVEERELEDEFSLLKESNGPASRALRRLHEADTGSVRAVTDVSGFGFLHAAALVTGSATAVIDVTAVPRSAQSERLMATGAISPLTDKNLLATEAHTRFADLPERDIAMLKVLLNDPQTSGGLLAVLSPGAASSLLNPAGQLPRPPRVVGRFEDSRDRPGDSARVTVASSSVAALPSILKETNVNSAAPDPYRL